MQTLTPSEFVLALEAGLIEYSLEPGASINGQFIGEYAPTISGVAVAVRADHGRATTL
jgi:hypothetical protein